MTPTRLPELIREALDLEALLEAKIAELAKAANIPVDSVYIRLLALKLDPGAAPSAGQCQSFLESSP